MVLPRSSWVVWIWVDKNRFFGSYPSKYDLVLASATRGGRHDAFVAAVKVNHVYYFTCVEYGSTIAEYVDETGERHVSDSFFLLTRNRIDDDDGEDDSQLQWLEFWPNKDPDYTPATDSARRDDEHLEALLNSYRDDAKPFYWD